MKETEKLSRSAIELLQEFASSPYFERAQRRARQSQEMQRTSRRLFAVPVRKRRCGSFPHERTARVKV